MSDSLPRSQLLLVALLSLAAAAVFVADIHLPLGFAAAIPYIVFAAVWLWVPRPRWALGTAAVASGLTIAGHLLSPGAADVWQALFNRGMTLLAIWAVTAGALWKHRLTARLGRELRREEELRAAERRHLEELRYALDQSAIVAATDAAGVITYANDKFCEISKYGREELIGRTHRIVNSGHHPPEFFADMWRAIAGGRVWRGEIRNRAKDGGFYWVDTTIVPFPDERGRPRQYMAIRGDITERKLAQQQLAEQAALTRLGEMAAVVAHEVRNPLAGIAGVMQVLRGRQPEGAPERQVMTEVLARVDALNRTLEDLLQFARPRPLKLTRVPLDTLLRETVRLFESDERCTGVKVEVPACDAVLRVDVDYLHQALLNLLLNAAQAMKGQGSVRVTVDRLDDRVRIQVADRGPGIPQELRPRVFEPFFTTKHRGTGLGLALVRKAVEQHGGEVRFDCPDEGGTVFHISLPLEPPHGAE
jgi:PAS domain S-box-containing protein